MSATDIVIAPLQRALDALIDARARTRDQAAALDGRTVTVTLSELALTLAFTGEDGRLVVRRASDAPQPDATLTGTTPAFLGAWLRDTGRDRATLPPGVTVTGDALLVRDLRALLAELEFDWEERASGLIGDAAAHQLGRMARAFGGWARYAGDRVTRDFAEYLREETRDLVAKDEVASFVDGVDAVRDDVERAAARVAMLEAGLRGAPTVAPEGAIAAAASTADDGPPHA